MIFASVILIFLGAIVFFHYIQGFFSAAISAILTVFAAVIAFSYHESLVPLLGGKMSDYSTPIALLSLIAARSVVPETHDPDARRPDLLGAALLVGAIVAVAYPLLEGRSLGWPAWNFALLAAGLVGLVALGVVEGRRQHVGVAPVLRTRVLRIPAFSAGLVVQLAFSAGLQGFFLIFAIWIQAGMGFSPLGAGLTALAFSVGSFLLAPMSVPPAERYGGMLLAAGGLLMGLGVLGVVLGAGDVGAGTDPWPVVPGLAIAGVGLSLLIIPLVNVVLAAVPNKVAGGAGGIFSTAQQLGGALGVAVIGSVFFSLQETHSFTSSLRGAAPIVIALFLVAGVLSLVLPGTAVSEEEVAGL